MINKTKFLSLSLAAAGFLMLSGDLTEVSAQRDPFAKTAAPAPKTPGTKSVSTNPKNVKPGEKPKPAAPMPVGAPAIQDRIAYYKKLREAAALQNQPIPKVTSVLTLDEMSVVGIFRTPRGFGAMVEAKPIKLSYTIYPGEKFFDAQLVAIEENRLVFRKVTKWSDGKLVASEENKTLRQYSVEQEVQGTAPVEPTASKTETAVNTTPPSTESKDPKTAPPLIISSPLEELNKQPAAKTKESAKDKPADKNKKGKASASKDRKPVRKTVKVAENKDQ